MSSTRMKGITDAKTSATKYPIGRPNIRGGLVSPRKSGVSRMEVSAVGQIKEPQSRR